MREAFDKYAPFVLVCLYVTALLFGLWELVNTNRNKLTVSEDLLKEIITQKDIHVAISKDNNRRLQEIQQMMEGGGNGNKSQEEEEGR